MSLLGVSAMPPAAIEKSLLSGLAAGLVYAIGAIILSGILSPILLGHLDGLPANPIAVIPLLLTYVIWAVVVVALALVVRGIGSGRETVGREHR